MTTHKVEKNAKLRFVTLYAVSLVLIFFVVTAFWKKRPGAQQDIVSQASENGNYFMQYDTMLHAKLDKLDNLYAVYLKDLENGNIETTDFFSAKNEFALALDSVSQQASFLANGSKKEAMEMLVSRFKKALEIRSRLINELTYLPKNKLLTKVEIPLSDTQANSEMQDLKKLLIEKEQTISDLHQKLQLQQTVKGGTGLEAQYVKELADKNTTINSLQTQLREKEAALQRASTTNNTGSSGNEWKQKYSSIKASYDKLAESEKAMKAAYKTVADDNRRLLAQLQSMKKD